ncbi:hypothetical protein HPB48_013270 [Haemaphysalis longicornis]|uniref:Uncharacterized protein n=1 Tax=Haemaphysalis longicornis TaxID=44386 RepID=A0A9J6GPN1_HAELO|nr:hypothetical protein HPB48_013270 [Haemaphysalis longicornis]
MVLPTNATSKQSGQLPLSIFEPVAWNSKPLSFHLRWEPAEEEGQAGLEISIPAMAANETKRNHGVNVTLLLKPGREYTVFASARGLGDNGEVYVGPETPMKVETTPLGK